MSEIARRVYAGIMTHTSSDEGTDERADEGVASFGSADVTGLLARGAPSDRSATDDLFPLVYAELRRLADRHLRGEQAGQTLQPTALVHEAYLRLLGSSNPSWENRAHFFGAAARAIRCILIDRARSRRR